MPFCGIFIVRPVSCGDFGFASFVTNVSMSPSFRFFRAINFYLQLHESKLD